MMVAQNIVPAVFYPKPSSPLLFQQLMNQRYVCWLYTLTQRNNPGTGGELMKMHLGVIHLIHFLVYRARSWVGSFFFFAISETQTRLEHLFMPHSTAGSNTPLPTLSEDDFYPFSLKHTYTETLFPFNHPFQAIGFVAKAGV